MANTFPNEGTVGVGTTAPTLGLIQVQLTADQAASSRMGVALSVAGDTNPAMLYARRDSGNVGYDWYFSRNQQDNDGLALHGDGSTTFGRDVNVNGNVVVMSHSLLQGGLSVGGAMNINGDAAVTKTVVVGQTLEVNGLATFKSDIAVAGALKLKTWELSVPDHVFEPGYRLADLDEVAAFVKAHRHLPEIPSAAAVEAEGLDTGRMLLLLLKKVEEITLHLVRHEGRLQSIEKATSASRPAGASRSPA